MGSAFHQLCPRYSGPLTPTALRLLGYGTPLPLPLRYIRFAVESRKLRKSGVAKYSREMPEFTVIRVGRKVSETNSVKS